MRVSLNFMVRITGMLVLAFMGMQVGVALSNPTPDDTQLLATQLLMLAGAGLGLIVTPRFTIEPVQELVRQMRGIPLTEILLIGGGALMGLIFGLLVAVPLAFLPKPMSEYLPIGISLMLGYMGASVVMSHRRELIETLRVWRTAAPVLLPNAVGTPGVPQQFLLDTSAIIDGRIAAVARSGFVEGTLLIPSFVLAELQALADSSDELRRIKGRRGLELLNQMQKGTDISVEPINVEVSGPNRVDDKLITLAREYHCPIITNDYNLNRVADLQGVKVLNLNQLSEAIRPPVVPDQRLSVVIRAEGNSRQQGVAYLDDGTPIIVEEARALIGQTVDVIVSRLIQTQTGRLIFAQLAPPAPRDDGRSSRRPTTLARSEEG